MRFQNLIRYHCLETSDQCHLYHDVKALWLTYNMFSVFVPCRSAPTRPKHSHPEKAKRGI
jgi:hypothetical protein